MPRIKKITTTASLEGKPEETVVAEKPVIKDTKKWYDSEEVKVDRYAKGTDAEKMFLHLNSLPLVRTIIPLDFNEKLGVTTTVILNGLRINILKGKFADLPSQVAEIIQDSFYATQEAERGRTINPETGVEKDSVIDGEGPRALR